ncbi:GNAT family N-acetyltransferase [Natronosalvus halobius]|uniref:GNAT family N-acetyltransferase n=1 Tax=Natronosalvus halobius TaxID=2953746 RepID=UPI00209CE27C|nr:GNAT family N-acetyltransferase [Natronosalvus halobius]USZ72239.1 GNAT family N-acetyltransferase [Natronosalvus halobius]
MLEIRPLTADDLDDALTLSTQAGWNQHPADWERLLACCSAGCFAGTVDGDLVATTTVITYGSDGNGADVSWVGMVLVDETHRGQGFGSRIFEHGLDYALGNGGDIVGLDATHLGEPIYRNYGFESVEPVFRWQGMLPRPEDVADEREPGTGRETIERLTLPDVDAVFEFDRHHVGVDRSTLLQELFAEPEVRGFYSQTSAGIEGYAIIRPGRTHWQIGPLVAAEPSVVDPLLRAVSADLPGEKVIVDSPERGATTSSLEALGLARERELVRMTYPDRESALATESVHGFLDFAFG